MKGGRERGNSFARDIVKITLLLKPGKPLPNWGEQKISGECFFKNEAENPAY